MEKKLFTANQLKMLALVLMFFDHFVSVFLPHNEIANLVFRVLGRTAAPVFCFFIAQGFYYTSDLKKYITRLLIFAAISHIPYILAFYPGYFVLGLDFIKATSVIWPLTMGLIALAVIKNEKIHIILRIALVGACCVVSYTANWNYIAVLWVVFFGLFHGNFVRQSLAFCIIGFFYLLIQPFRLYGIFHPIYPQWFQLGIFLALPLLALYTGKQGKKSKFNAWFFYVFYPAHLLFLFLLNHLTPVKNILAEFIGK